MSLNNHLLVSLNCGGKTDELDVQFRFGETREYVYRVGDQVHVLESERATTPRRAVVAGIAALRGAEGSCQVEPKELYFRILIIDDVIVSVTPTSAEDYEMLENCEDKH